jgi:hypothetical protein
MSHPALHPWRVLVLDPDPADPKWLIATIADPHHVRPADPAGTKPDDVTRAWAGGTLTAVRHARVWRIDEGEISGCGSATAPGQHPHP